jgi:hypothetical protein
LAGQRAGFDAVLPRTGTLRSLPFGATRQSHYDYRNGRREPVGSSNEDFLRNQYSEDVALFAGGGARRRVDQLSRIEAGLRVTVFVMADQGKIEAMGAEVLKSLRLCNVPGRGA